jgi:SNF2 family DNA or RNA helicase
MCQGTGKATVMQRVIDETITHDPETGEPVSEYAKYEAGEGECPKCRGTGLNDVLSRTVETVDCPKIDVIKDYLEEYEDEGRLVIWAGFQASVDLLIEVARKAGWTVLKIDGRGTVAVPETVAVEELLSAMDASDPNRQALRLKHPKVCVIGNSIAGGIALTLTASNTAIYYSNGSDGGARRQSEARIHRAGMDQNRGCQIIDLQCLEIDALVLNSLNTKRRLESITLGEILESLGEKQ